MVIIVVFRCAVRNSFSIAKTLRLLSHVCVCSRLGLCAPTPTANERLIPFICSLFGFFFVYMYFILFRAFVSPVFYTRSFMVCSLVCLQNKIRNVELTRDRNEPKHARNISLGCAQRLRSETHEKLHANKSNVFLRLLNVFKSILKKAER